MLSGSRGWKIVVIAGVLILAGIQMLGIGLLGELQVRHFHAPTSRAPYAIDRILRLRPSVPLARTNYTARILGTAHDLTGQTLDGDFNRTSGGSPATAGALPEPNPRRTMAHAS